MIPYIVPTLPEKQKAALHELVKVPLVYTAVAVRNWHAFATLGVQRIDCPGSYFSSVYLSGTSHIGGYGGPQSPDDPALVFMVRPPYPPGPGTQPAQHRPAPLGRATVRGSGCPSGTTSGGRLLIQ